MSEQANEFLQQASQALQAGQFEQALDLIDKSIELLPSSSDAHVIRGISLAQLGRSDEATEAFRKGISVNPNNPKAYYNLATHQYQLGQRTEAHAMANEALRLDPGHAAARDLVQRVEQEQEAEREAARAQSAPPAGTGVGPAPAAAPTGPVEPPPSGIDGPYAAQSPYSTPPQTPSPYQRPGYEPVSNHAVPFVENLGSKWVTFGWAIVGVSLAIFAISLMITPWNAISEAISDPANAQSIMSQIQGGSPINTLLSFVGYALQLSALTWMILDLMDRRGNWVWLVPFIPCCCCGFHWMILPIYILAGRK